MSAGEIIGVFLISFVSFSAGRVVGWLQGVNWAADKIGMPKVSWREVFRRGPRAP